jgi:hypothetical protein
MKTLSRKLSLLGLMPSNFTTLAKAKSHKRRQVKQFAPATEEEQQQLIKALYACSSKPVVLSTFSGVSNKFHWTKPAPKVDQFGLFSRIGRL